MGLVFNADVENILNVFFFEHFQNFFNKLGKLIS